MESKITCIICPIGCEMTIHHKEGLITKIEGHQCKKGIGYAKEELFDPKRTLTTTLIVKDGELSLVSVKSNKPIPKDKIFVVMDAIAEFEVHAPIEIGDVLVENVVGLEVDIVATKNVGKTTIKACENEEFIRVCLLLNLERSRNTHHVLKSNTFQDRQDLPYIL
ncbi:MAG: DUF1667 domain-containing protein [Thermoplasmata archaeon]|nr:MAG: DUF1667 domain-containing protein [Thermoplasmata archaeon]